MIWSSFTTRGLSIRLMDWKHQPIMIVSSSPKDWNAKVQGCKDSAWYYMYPLWTRVTPRHIYSPASIALVSKSRFLSEKVCSSPRNRNTCQPRFRWEELFVAGKQPKESPRASEHWGLGWKLARRMWSTKRIVILLSLWVQKRVALHSYQKPITFSVGNNNLGMPGPIFTTCFRT